MPAGQRLFLCLNKLLFSESSSLLSVQVRPEVDLAWSFCDWSFIWHIINKRKREIIRKSHPLDIDWIDFKLYRFWKVRRQYLVEHFHPRFFTFFWFSIRIVRKAFMMFSFRFYFAACSTLPPLLSRWLLSWWFSSTIHEKSWVTMLVYFFFVSNREYMFEVAHKNNLLNVFRVYFRDIRTTSTGTSLMFLSSTLNI